MVSSRAAFALGDLESAERWAQQALDLTPRRARDRVQAIGEAERALAAGNLGECLSLQGHFAEAEGLLREQQEIYPEVFPAGHPALETNRDRLRELYSRWGKPPPKEP